MKRINITCPACGSRAYLRPASVVYGDKAPDPDAKYYVCGRYPACDCYVAAHRKTMLPMGTLADKALRKKRHDAHVALDSLWKNGIMSRKEAYRLLQLSMGLPAEDAHTRFVNEAFLSRRRKVCTGVVRIGLKKAVSGSHEYCVATFTKIADFAGEDLAHIRAYADGFVAQIKDINVQRAQAGAAASSIIGDGDASHLELPDNGAHFALGAVIDGEREELPA